MPVSISTHLVVRQYQEGRERFQLLPEVEPPAAAHLARLLPQPLELTANSGQVALLDAALGPDGKNLVYSAIVGPGAPRIGVTKHGFPESAPHFREKRKVKVVIPLVARGKVEIENGSQRVLNRHSRFAMPDITITELVNLLVGGRRKRRCRGRSGQRRGARRMVEPEELRWLWWGLLICEGIILVDLGAFRRLDRACIIRDTR